jgi:transcriptional regulator with XRE-family HTH domain
MKPLAHWLDEKQVGLPELVEASGLDRKRVAAIASGNYTPSPAERQRLAAALGLAVGDVSWGHAVPVDHMYGHGPQFGRSP